MKNYVVTFLILLLAGQFAPAAENKSFYSDGTITAGQEWNMVGVHDTPPAHTTVNMTGGAVWVIGAWDTSILNISGGNVSGSVNAENQSIVNIYDNAVLPLVYGSGGTVNVYGGTIDILDVTNIANLYGGDITAYIWAHPASTVNIFGTGLFKTDFGGTFGDGYVTGFWEGGTTEFTIDLAHDTYSRINLITIPEPASLLLLVLGGLLASHRKC